MVTGSGWVAVGCWMSFTGRILFFFFPKEPALKVEGQGETGRSRDVLCRERFSGYVFTEMVLKEISTRELSNKS